MNDREHFHHPKRYPVPLWSQPATPILSHLQIHLFSVTVVLHFPEIHSVEIVDCVIAYLWLISLSIMPSTCILLVA